MRILRNKHYEAVGTVMPQGDKFRLATWRPDGPSGHEVLTARELERELGWAWEEDPTAGAALETWSDTPEWEHGLKVCQYIACWNSCSYYGRYDLARQLDHAGTIDKALALIPEIRRQLNKEKKL